MHTSGVKRQNQSRIRVFLASAQYFAPATHPKHHSGSGLGDGALAEEDAFPAPCGGPTSLWPASSESIIWYLERPEAGFDS